MTAGARIRVVAAAIRRADGAVLLSLRPAHAAQGGLWEFPGGKIEGSEHEIDALARELREELGIAIARATPLISVHHRYPDFEVELTVLEVREWTGEPYGREGQAIRWVQPGDLGAYRFPAANLPVATAVGLPRLALVTPGPADGEAAFAAGLERCLAAGVELVQLRLPGAAPATLRRIGRRALAACKAHGARLLINGEADDMLAIGAHGLHLTAARLLRLTARPVASDVLLSASCHDHAELRQAERIGVDFVYVAPVRATTSHPGAAALGWDGLQRLAGAARMPVFALGGMDAAAAQPAVRTGCQGVAMLGGLWRCADPGAVVRAVRAAVEAASGAVAQR